MGDYGLNKKLAEDYLIELYNKEGFPITIFRPSYIYGEGNNLPREGYFFNRILNGLAIPVPRSNITTQFIYIDDVVNIFESSLHVDKAIGEAYNVTYEDEVSWDKLINTAMKVCNKNVPIVTIDEKELDNNMKGYFPFRNINYALSISKLKKHGLYEPKINLIEGLSKSLEWYLKAQPELKNENEKMSKAGNVLKLVR